MLSRYLGGGQRSTGPCQGAIVPYESAFPGSAQFCSFCSHLIWSEEVKAIVVTCRDLYEPRYGPKVALRC